MKGFIEVTEEIEREGFSGTRKVLININSISSINNRYISALFSDYVGNCERYLYDGARIFLTVERTVPIIEDINYLGESENHTVNYIKCRETIEEVKALIEQAQKE